MSTWGMAAGSGAGTAFTPASRSGCKSCKGTGLCLSPPQQRRLGDAGCGCWADRATSSSTTTFPCSAHQVIDHRPQRCHRAATAWLPDVNICPAIPPGTGATASKSSMPKGSSTETGKTNPWIALKLHFHLPKQRPLAREGLTMHTQRHCFKGRSSCRRCLHLPRHAPDTRRKILELYWPLSRRGCPLQQTDSKDPQTLDNWFYAFSVDFMHISYLSWQQGGYKRNQVQDYLLNRWGKPVPCKKVPLNKIQSSSAKPVTCRPVLSTNDWITASLWSHKNQTNVKSFLFPQYQMHYFMLTKRLHHISFTPSLAIFLSCFL